MISWTEQSIKNVSYDLSCFFKNTYFDFSCCFKKNSKANCYLLDSTGESKITNSCSCSMLGNWKLHPHFSSKLTLLAFSLSSVPCPSSIPSCLPDWYYGSPWKTVCMPAKTLITSFLQWPSEIRYVRLIILLPTSTHMPSPCNLLSTENWA